MAETYCIQRATINKGTAVNKIVDEWPFLFEAVHLFEHTQTLLGFAVQTRLSEELTPKEKPIKDFLNLKGIEILEGPLSLIAGIAKYFKENPHHLMYQNEVGLAPPRLNVLKHKMCFCMKCLKLNADQSIALPK